MTSTRSARFGFAAVAVAISMIGVGCASTNDSASQTRQAGTDQSCTSMWAPININLFDRDRDFTLNGIFPEQYEKKVRRGELAVVTVHPCEPTEFNIRRSGTTGILQLNAIGLDVDLKADGADCGDPATCLMWKPIFNRQFKEIGSAVFAHWENQMDIHAIRAENIAGRPKTAWDYFDSYSGGMRQVQKNPNPDSQFVYQSAGGLLDLIADAIWGLNPGTQYMLDVLLSDEDNPERPPTPPTITSALDSAKACLDVPGGQVYAPARVQLWDCNGSKAQQWVLEPRSNVVAQYRIHTALDYSYCLDAQREHPDTVRIAKCDGASYVDWIWRQDGSLMPARDNTHFLEPKSDTYVPGTNLTLGDGGSDKKQQWNLSTSVTP